MISVRERLVGAYTSLKWLRSVLLSVPFLSASKFFSAKSRSSWSDSTASLPFAASKMRDIELVVVVRRISRVPNT